MLKRKRNFDYKDYNNNRDNIKQKSSTKESKFVRLYIAFVILLGIILVLYIGQIMQITHLNYQVESLENKLNKIEDNNHHLNLKLAKKSSLKQIEKIARNKLNMVDPEKTQVLVINKNNQSPNFSKNQKENKSILHTFTSILNKIRTVKAGSP